MADLFTVVALVGGSLLAIFLIVSILFFNTTMMNQIPLVTQSTAMFWLAIVWTILLVGFVIWAFVRLFSSPVVVQPTYNTCNTCALDMKQVNVPQARPPQQLPQPIQVNQQKSYVASNAPSGFDPKGNTVYGNQSPY